MGRLESPSDGQCRCGDVRIRISARPILTMACHCKGCQRMSSSAFSLSAAVPTTGFEVIRGQPVLGGAQPGTSTLLLSSMYDLDVHTLSSGICECPGNHAGGRIMVRTFSSRLGLSQSCLGRRRPRCTDTLSFRPWKITQN